MTKTISVKELRMNFPKIRKELAKGVHFTIIYRSKPIAQLLPTLEFYSQPFNDQINDGNRYLPKDFGEFLKDIDKYRIKVSNKPIDIVKLIRKDRGYDD